MKPKEELKVIISYKGSIGQDLKNNKRRTREFGTGAGTSTRTSMCFICFMKTEKMTGLTTSRICQKGR